MNSPEVSVPGSLARISFRMTMAAGGQMSSPGVQVPPEQTSPPVQASPSSQLAVLLLVAQPLVGLQLSSVQTLPSSQVSGVPGAQKLATQASAPLQTLPSSHSEAKVHSPNGLPSARWPGDEVSVEIVVCRTKPTPAVASGLRFIDTPSVPPSPEP